VENKVEDADIIKVAIQLAREQARQHASTIIEEAQTMAELSAKGLLLGKSQTPRTMLQAAFPSSNLIVDETRRRLESAIPEKGEEEEENGEELLEKERRREEEEDQMKQHLGQMVEEAKGGGLDDGDFVQAAVDMAREQALDHVSTIIAEAQTMAELSAKGLLLGKSQTPRTMLQAAFPSSNLIVDGARRLSEGGGGGGGQQIPLESVRSRRRSSILLQMEKQYNFLVDDP